ncbi:MAG TPA: TatD family hydrolase [Candidatus Saccharimonadales bacterium]|nr:TatD family hydrolase [Candidatus Saccharimonadales bacterium]
MPATTSSVDLFDTHCHTHEMVQRITPVYDKWHSDGLERTPESTIAAAHEAGVGRMLCIGTSLADSELAIDFVTDKEQMWASIGIHPHEAAVALAGGHLDAFRSLVGRPKVVAVGECGLDYFYEHSPREAQIKVLKAQIELALEHHLPLSFHVREAFDDFWPIFDSYRGADLRGVLHSYTDTLANLEQAVKRGLYVGVNGIATFAKHDDQLAMYKAIPKELLVLETDAPFLTPVPFRGKVCESKHVRVTAAFVADLRGETLGSLAASTTGNARRLFKV